MKWLLITNEQEKNGLVEMYASLHNGLLTEDYYRNRPTLGKVKMTDFAKKFAASFNQNR